MQRFSVFFFCLLASLASSNLRAQVFECHSSVLTCLEPGYSCLRNPTSLTPVSSVADGGEGFNGGGTCGTRPCTLLGLPVRCPCGTPTSTGVCGLSTGGGGRCCGEGVPCQASVEKLNQMLVLNPSPSDGERVNATVGFPVAPTQTWLPAEGTQRVAARHEPAFDKLRGFFRDLSSIRFSAEVTLWRPDRNAEGTFLYETDGKRYYLKSTIDPRAGLAPSLEAAYDLDHYQIFYPEDSRLHLYRTPPSHLAAPFPNPLFLPLGFLGWKDDDCSTCELDLAAVLDQARWVARVGAARGVEGAVSDTVWLPGGVFGGEPYAFQILVNRKSEQLERIELVRPQGKKISTLELLDWERPLQSREAFPHHIVLRGYDETGNVGAVLHVHFQGLEINRPAASERFTIDESGARIVIDEDARTFLKHPQMRPPE